ncbi:prolyl oligopeptidase family serine peptidase [Flammeovirga yaeyamensis]|uniref:Prolyl oligopeptidase family serine peptidase n=1 Tax=Flammeovirga yaeyamensis TaxID=367791 RepID=A0AAX1N7P8_9BACT|nr:prolyl oligopeptidase family serine peptidase [Flammeovirga yaeyamensis]MBB3699082.1 dipeptidyl aminopeptidase/acylaminoacyl peptidase [Flammeovirga yaeyamensis]NMF36516.1 S9 family peptidase [Flammeovirga yaeyamensis]QWG03526.1 prolyl oligopeptidase family serine peptidase [Flammeovirga yaeyamensis]
MNKLYTLLGILCLPIIALSQTDNQSTLSIDDIMGGEHFIGQTPHSPFWAKDSKTVYFYWNKEDKSFDQLYKFDVKSKKYTVVDAEEQKHLPTSKAVWNKKKSQSIYSKEGNIYLFDTKKGISTQLTSSSDYDSSPEYLLNEEKISFKRANNLYTLDLSNGLIHQITHFKKGNAPKKGKKSDQQKFLEDQQLELFEIVRNRKDRKEESKAHKDALKLNNTSNIYIGNKYVFDVKLSSDENYVVYSLGTSAGNFATEMPVWVEGTGYVKMQNARAKVGSPEDTYENYIYDIQKDSVITIDLSGLEGLDKTPEFFSDYDKSAEDYKKTVVMHEAHFSPISNHAVVDIRSYDNKDRWIAQINFIDGTLTQIDHQHDEAWIGGPGISGWNFWVAPIGWVNDETIWYQSEKTGFSHVYTYNVVSKKTTQVTEGAFEINETKVSNDGQYFYLTSNKERPAEQHLYKVSINGGEMLKITENVGKHETLLSPDEKYIVDRYSYANKPWEIYLQQNKKGAESTQITKSTSEAFDNYEWRDPEIIQFDAKDGEKVHARIYKPSKEKDLHKAVIFVHGAGYLQNVHKWWSAYHREYMFHNLLVDNGYTVLDIDYRASAGYGRDWRTGIYRHMGEKDLSDHVDGAKYLIKEHGIDASKVGIYGGSYGGFITLMAMFNEGDTFKAGAAIRSVTDWAHYNHPYTSNILNTPALDPDAYKKSSPIYFAEGLKGDLLILHGMVDDNVQFSDVVRLSQRLIELKKENWEMAIYPIEPHGFKETSSWIDEYKRIFKLFQEKL